MNKRIGIVGWNTGANSWGVTMMYVDFFSQFGIVEIIMHNETTVREGLDLLVLPGGPDVDPMRYLTVNDEFSLFNGKPCVFKERFDRMLLPKYIEARIPIFGICRGHQTLAVEFGGKLIQDMTEVGLQHASNTEDRTKRVHDLKMNKINIGLIPELSTASFSVNSIHHQAIDANHLPKIGKVLAIQYQSKPEEFGTIEAMTYLPEYPAHTVQWHPEDIRDEFSIKLILNLLYEQS